MLAVSMFGHCASHWGSAKKDSQGMVRPGHSSAYTTCHYWVLEGTEAAVSFRVYYHPTQGSSHTKWESLLSALTHLSKVLCLQPQGGEWETLTIPGLPANFTQLPASSTDCLINRSLLI